MRPISTAIEEVLHEELKAVSKATKIKIKKIIADALAAHLAKLSKKVRK